MNSGMTGAPEQITVWARRASSAEGGEDAMEQAMEQRPAVALLVETSNSYARGVLQGIASYIREHQSWSVFLPELGRGDSPPPWLSNWRGDGIIARIENRRIAEVVRQCRLPTVDVSAQRLVPSTPWVVTHHEAFARVAAEHLLRRGFRNFGYCSDPAFNWSKWYGEHFVRIIGEAGCECRLYESSVTRGRRSWNQEHQRLRDWARALPRPVGVMACDDIKAQELLNACRDLDIAVPEEAAVVGTDNDELLCNLATPPLSSVIPNTRLTGYRAADLLDQMMAGRKVGPQAFLIEPLGIATRQSTDVLAIEDPDVASAATFIRERACDGINVDDVLRVVPVSRRVLESRFRKLLGRTPHQEISRLKFDRVRQLLVETDLPLSRIAQLTGFEHIEYLSAAFKKNFGVPPRQYRARQRK